MPRITVVGLSLVAFVVAGCGGSTVKEPGTGGGGAGGGGTTTTGTGGAGTGGGGTGGSPSGCPATLPASQSACADPELVCTYGDSPLPHCRNYAVCGAGAWNVTLAPPDCDQPPPDCPATPPSNGSVCSGEGATCSFGDGTICDCTTCTGGPCGPPPPVWACGAPASGCPSSPPNAGTGCAQEGQQCLYGNPCLSGVNAICKGGAWTWETTACPE